MVLRKLFAIVLFAATFGCADGPKTPVSPSVVEPPPVITAIIDNIRIDHNEGVYGNRPVTVNPNQPLSAGEIRVNSAISGGTMDLYIFLHSSVIDGKARRCVNAPFDCAAALAGPERTVNGQNVVVGKAANLDVTPTDIVYVARDGHVSGNLTLTITGLR